MSKDIIKSNSNYTALVIVPIFIFILLLFAYLLKGSDVALLNPKGFVASEQNRLLLTVVGIMMALAIPTLAFLFFTVWKYRDTNTSPKLKNPQKKHGKGLVFAMWGVPLSMLFILASIMIPATHDLAPQKSIVSDANPITIQVVALRWKWLFIYPEQKVATVNFVQIPVNTPIKFDITADEAPMNSFWIPHLGGQLYAMTGHSNLLNLMSDEIGDFRGSAAEISGQGFAGMVFTARSSSEIDFDNWILNQQMSGSVLTEEEYSKLLVPTENNEPQFFAIKQTDLYDKILSKYEGSHGSHEGDDH